MPRISSSEAISRSSIHARRPSTSVDMYPAPWRSKAEVVMTTSAPANTNFTTPATSATPVEAASDALVRPERIAIQSIGSRISSGSLSANRSVSFIADRSMSGSSRRLNSTRPVAPRPTSCSAKWPIELR